MIPQWHLSAPVSHLVEGTLRLACCQHLCPQCEPYMSPASLQTLQEQQVGLTQASVKLLLLSWAPECVRFPVCCKSEICFPQSSCTLETQAKSSRGSSSWCRIAGSGCLMRVSDLPLLWENLCNNLDSPPGALDLTLLKILPSYSSCSFCMS